MSVTETAPRQRYWSAEAYARDAAAQFGAAKSAHDVATMRHVFFESATLYTRTLDILARSVQNRHPDLADVASANLITLHRTLAGMHVLAPEVVSLPIAARDAERERMVQDLIVGALEAAGRSLHVAQLEKRIAEWDLLGEVPPQRIHQALVSLEAQGVLVSEGNRCRLTGAALHPLNLDHEGLRAMLPADEYARLCEHGFCGISEVAARSARFREVAREYLGWEEGVAEGIARACGVIEAYSAAFPAGVEHRDLIHSSIPRPYQYEAFAVFRGMGYSGQVIEAPPGSGKTLVGMLCIQDWLARLTEGERVLVLVPSQSYQRQWVRELCYLPQGLQLSPESVWAGAPAALEHHPADGHGRPVVLVMTYAALADQAAEDLQCDPAATTCPSIEALIEAQQIRHVILDEVHKAAQRPASPTARMAQLLAGWNRDGKIRNLVGFSGTAEAYQERLAALGLEFAFKVPAVETVAHGFVAPFGELAIPFAYSEREKRIHDALDAYKEHLRDFLAAVGGAGLRARWARIPLERRLEAVHALHPEAARKEADALESRAVAAGFGMEPLTLPEAWMVALLQSLEGWDDAALAEAAEDPAAAQASLSECRRIAAEVRGVVRLPSLAQRLGRVVEGGVPDLQAAAFGESRAVRRAGVRDALAATVCGCALSFAEWYRQTGEGRVGAIRAALGAEQQTRTFTGAIIFDAGHPIPWEHIPPAPGFAGVGGTFAELIRDPLPGITPMAALSGEIYLPLEPAGLPERIAEFIRGTIMVEEIGTEILEMATRGLPVRPEAGTRLLASIREHLKGYVEGLQVSRHGRHVKRGEFRSAVLKPLRHSLGELGLGHLQERVARRLTARNRHLAGLAGAFYDYAVTAELFRAAEPRVWVGTDGVRRACAVVPLPTGPRRQLLYEMASRILDAPELEINVILVSAWARTGWNVRLPNVLLDATATRNAVAWQQLRGRAMRALPGWSPACGRAAALLTRARPHSPAPSDDGPPAADVAEAWRSLQVEGASEQADPEVLGLLAGLVEGGEEELRERVRGTPPETWPAAMRVRLLLRLLHRHNKVTHLYELLKCTGVSQVVKAGRRWRRRPSLEIKHAREDSVDPLTGAYSSGAEHAPLVYAVDPRTDLPEELEAKLAAVLEGADERIILGWLRAAGLHSTGPDTPAPGCPMEGASGGGGFAGAASE